MSIIARMTYVIDDIDESEFPEIDSVIALKGRCIIPSVQVDETNILMRPALNSTGKIYIKYHGLPEDLIGCIRVTSIGNAHNGVGPMETENEIEKFVDGQWEVLK